MKKKSIASMMLGLALTLSACGSNVAGKTTDSSVTEESISTEESTENSTEEAAETSETTEASSEETEDATTVESQDAESAEDDNSIEESAEDTTDDTADTDEESDAEPNTEETTSDENIETSPFVLWSYNGYVDECKEYTWCDDFTDKDFDKDGTTDRLYRTHHEEPQTADYVIEFGNGNKLEIDGVWETGFPHIQMDDLNGDGEKDVLFTLSYDTSTDPWAFGNMLVYEYNSADKSYKEAELPFEKTDEVGSTALMVDYGVPTEDGHISFDVKKAGYSATLLTDNDFISNYWTKEATSEERNVYEASIEDYQGSKAIHCNMEMITKSGITVSFYIVNENGQYVIKDMGSTDDLIQAKVNEIKEMSASENTEQTEVQATAATPQTGGHLVVIDPGHQSKGMSEKEPNGPGSSNMKAKVTGGTSGKTSGLTEYQLNLTIGLLLRDELVSRGYTVIMTRESNDVSLSNVDRAQIANNAGAEVFIRIHANGSNDTSVNGAMTICQTSSNPYNAAYYSQSRKLSDCVLGAYCSATGFKKQSVWETDTMTGINWANVPSTIIEMGYMSNPTDDANMANPEMQKKMAVGIANGIDNYFAQ